MATIASTATGHERGTPGFRRLGAAMWCAGLATFVLVYSPQVLLPTFAAEFAVSSSTASLALSATTLALAVAVVPLSAVCESWGRTRMMTAALAVSAALGLIEPFAPSFGVLVVLRALQGVALAALPALAMAHTTREVAARWLGGAVGLLIAGNALGGLTGRLVTGFVADVAGWRVALGVVGGVSLLCMVAFRLLLPAPRTPDPPRVRLRELGRPIGRHLADPVLRGLFAVSFLVMGAFVTVYNYSGFRLEAAPFGVPVGLAGLVFLGYLAGPVVSPWAGRVADRHGRAPVVAAGLAVAAAGAWVTLPANLVVICIGVLLVTVGFFTAHAVASGWAGRRAADLPDGSPALASSLYLLAYYAGSSVGGSLGGVAYDHLGWLGVSCFLTLLLAAGFLVALRLRTSSRGRAPVRGRPRVRRGRRP
ncbi:MFS transporter [Pseudonocardia benzenivorans]|uniref:MFS transporter n=1 Tax=Pseudonocardia benzenivorans TaxID=228005 RepID=A0ABW3VGU9_9PSEU